MLFANDLKLFLKANFIAVFQFKKISIRGLSEQIITQNQNTDPPVIFFLHGFIEITLKVSINNIDYLDISFDYKLRFQYHINLTTLKALKIADTALRVYIISSENHQ